MRGTGGKRRERKGSWREGTNYCKESRKMHTTLTLRLKGKPFFCLIFLYGRRAEEPLVKGADRC